jgi:hypothetical protein
MKRGSLSDVPVNGILINKNFIHIYMLNNLLGVYRISSINLNIVVSRRVHGLGNAQLIHQNNKLGTKIKI